MELMVVYTGICLVMGFVIGFLLLKKQEDDYRYLCLTKFVPIEDQERYEARMNEISKRGRRTTALFFLMTFFFTNGLLNLFYIIMQSI